MAYRVLKAGGLGFYGGTYVEVKDNENIQKLAKPPFTFSLWVRPIKWEANGLRMAGKGDGYLLYGGWHIEQRTFWPNYALWWNDGVNRSKLDFSMYEGNLYLITFMFSSTNMTFYLNKSRASASIDNPPKGAVGYSLYLGRSSENSYAKHYNHGVYGYNRLLSDSEVYQIYDDPLNPPRDGLMLWYPLNECEGDTVHDWSGYGNHGVRYGAEWVIKKANRVVSI
jgi:hypothetical protein